jgi:hypothetical protein
MTQALYAGMNNNTLKKKRSNKKQAVSQNLQSGQGSEDAGFSQLNLILDF